MLVRARVSPTDYNQLFSNYEFDSKNGAMVQYSCREFEFGQSCTRVKVDFCEHIQIALECFSKLWYNDIKTMILTFINIYGVVY